MKSKQLTQKDVYQFLVTESVMCQKFAARIMYILQTEGWGTISREDAERIRGKLDKIDSGLREVVLDIDSSRVTK